ncbi:MAG: PfkB family carbohydrate kinase [Candidatus Bathyarchaeota archaeon]|nr:PfkB family carbohydrate kinase [Candidatus Termiticorpusculum sp.]
MVVQSSSVCVVGSFSLDSIVVPGRDKPFHNLGGATTYTSFAVKILGESVSVVSRVGGDFPEAYLWWLHEEGIDVLAVKRYLQETTAHFELCYSRDFSERALKLTCKGYPISLGDIPGDLCAKAIHVAPIVDELSYGTMEHLKSCCDFLSFDPQGFLRSFDENGSVTPNLQVDKRVLSLVDVCKVSQDELFVLTGQSELKAAVRAVHDAGVETVIVTMGAKGSLLSIEGTPYTIPACKPNVLVDPTGAGDVFIGAFLTEYLKGKESLWCASIGSAAASMVIEGIGSTYFGEKQEILKRATVLYEKELKQ